MRYVGLHCVAYAISCSSHAPIRLKSCIANYTTVVRKPPGLPVSKRKQKKRRCGYTVSLYKIMGKLEYYQLLKITTVKTTEITHRNGQYETAHLQNIYLYKCTKKHRQLLVCCAVQQTDDCSRRNPCPETHSLGAVEQRCHNWLQFVLVS